MSIANPALDEFITVTEVDCGPVFADPIFKRNYRQSAPDFPHHIVAFYRRADGAFIPASYLHFRPYDEMMLIGGACTHGDIVRAMTPEQQQAVHAAGGLMLQTTRFALAKFGPRCQAVFGHCGDARSWSVLERAGFERTDAGYIVACWTRPLGHALRRELIAKAHAIGPF